MHDKNSYITNFLQFCFCEIRFIRFKSPKELKTFLARLTWLILTLTIIFNIIQYSTLSRRSTMPIAENNSYAYQDSINSASDDDTDFERFCVIATVYNPVSFQSRYNSYIQFEQHMSSFGVYLITIELVVGNQSFKVTQANNSRHLQFKTDDILWYKENLINIGIKRSPDHCKYIAWIDLEVEFLNKNWIRETISSLKNSKIVQLFEIVRILGPNLEVLDTQKAYGWCNARNRTGLTGLLRKKYKMKFKSYCTAGYAWAAKKSTLLEIGGLFDKGILGDGNWFT
jgi:hypothetical protein